MSADQIIAAIDAEVGALVLPRFTLDDAWWLGNRIRQAAHDTGGGVAIEVRRGVLPVFGSVLDGATADNLGWARRKLEVTLHFERASFAMYHVLQAKGVTVAHFGLDPTRYVAGGGAVPIFVAGVGMVGAAAMSGRPQDEDHAMVIAALRALQHEVI